MERRHIALAAVLASTLALPACAGAQGTSPGRSLNGHDTQALAEVELDDLRIDDSLTRALAELGSTPDTASSFHRVDRAEGAPSIDGTRDSHAALARAAEASLPTPIVALLSRWRVAPPDLAACTRRSGDLSDGDRDGLPRHGDYVFDCKDLAVNGRRVSLSGTATVSDDDDGDAHSGFELDFARLSASSAPAAVSSRESPWSKELSGSLRADPSPGGRWTFTKDYDLESSMAPAGPSAPRTASITGETTSSYAPTDASHPADAGDVSIDSVTSVSLSDGTDVTVRRVARPPLHTTAACRADSPLGYDAGTLTLEQEQKVLATMTFLGCGQLSATDGGSPLALDES